MFQVTTQHIDRALYCLSLICAAALAFWCISEYSENNEVTEVSFQRFDPNEDGRQYPSMTLCVKDSYKEFELNKYNDSTLNSSSYGRFLVGQYWSNGMPSIQYNLVSFDVRDYIIGTCVTTLDSLGSASGCQKLGHVQLFTRLWIGGLMKCMSFKHVVKGAIDEVFIAINSSIFPNGVRPTHDGLSIMFHYPDQMTTSLKNLFYKWPEITYQMDEYYSMRFDISHVEILKRRINGQEECYDWKNYDLTTTEDVMRSVGCIPPYWESRHGGPQCISQLQMRNMVVQYYDKAAQNDKFQKYVHPCIEITKMEVKFEQLSVKEIDFGYASIFERFKEDAGTSKGWFVIDTSLWKSTYFKEIRKVKAYSFQSMVGNSGGYIGLFVGLTISDLFGFAIKIYFKIKDIYLNWRQIEI